MSQCGREKYIFSVSLAFLYHSMQEKLPVASFLYYHVFERNCQWQVLQIRLYLKAFCEKYQPSYAVRTSMSDYREQDWMTNIPLYAVKWIKNYVNQ